MSPAEQRAAVVAEARSWIGTPYHHRAGIKGVGVDCAMILVRVYAAAGMIQADFDPGEYPQHWHLHQTRELYVEQILAMGAREVAEPMPGDVVVFKVGNCFAHGGIVTGKRGVTPATGWPWLVHAWQLAGLVDESNAALTGQMPDSRRFFSLWGAA